MSPIFRRETAPRASTNPDDWRPQRFGGNYRSIRDALIEPGWSGLRVLAHYDGGAMRLADEDGIDCTAEFAAVAEALTTSALAGDFIVDGYLTVQATQVAAGKPLAEITAPTGGQVMTQWILGSRAARPSVQATRLDPDRPVAFVAVDLLRVDGTSLLDVPLLERKRLLDGSLSQTELVRVTPFVRPPIGNFLATWRGMGFDELAYKAANSRYVPNLASKDWSILPMPVK
jgi:ATP-dependent DNA ligase